MASHGEDDDYNRKQQYHQRRQQQQQQQQYSSPGNVEGRQQQRAGAASSPAPAPPPSLLRQWSDLLSSPSDWLSLSASSCSGCLAQVDDGDTGEMEVTSGGGANNANDANSTAASAGAPPVGTSTTAGTTASAAVEFDPNNILRLRPSSSEGGEFSLLDHDESTAAPSRECSRLSLNLKLNATVDSADANSIVSIYSYNREVGGSSLKEGASSSSSSSSKVEGVEVCTTSADDQTCPLCDDNMSPFDIIHPIQCTASDCHYNFCVNCASSLLKSSKEDYQMASDGSFQVKVKLQCPNCRADISRSIEGVIRSRREEASAVAAAVEAESIVSMMNEEKKMPAVHSDEIQVAPPSLLRFENRSGALKEVRRRRIDEMIEKIESMPTPSSVRDHVLAVHGQQQQHHHHQQVVTTQGSGSSASLLDEDLSQSSSSSLEDNVADSSSPYNPRRSVSSAEAAMSHTAPNSLAFISSPEDNNNRFVTPSKLRRTLSLQTPASPPLLESFPDKTSPRSVFDMDYQSFGGHSDKTDSEEAQVQADTTKRDEKQRASTTKQQGHSTPSRGKSRSSNKGSSNNNSKLEGINFTDGEGGFFSNAIDLGWCCNYDIATSTNENVIDIRSNNNNNSASAPPEVEGRVGCGGYVDYSGSYHPCSDAGGELEGATDISDDGPCQGCIFRRGMHDGNTNSGSDENPDEEELYYDSDPGQHFAVGSWTSPRTSHRHRGGDKDETEELESSLSTSASSETVRQRAKSRWRRGRGRRSKSSNKGRRRSQSKSRRSDGKSGVVVASSQDLCEVKDNDNVASSQGAQAAKTQDDGLQRRSQEDQQAYLYDYFSQNDDASANAMRTGFYSTRENDVGQYVEEALNSRWRLQWHVSVARSSKSGKQSRVPPKMCDVWIERGYRRNRTEIVEPKLMWREVSQPNLQEKRQLGGSTIRPYRVSLFAVRRIFQVGNTEEDWEKMDAADRKLTPPRRQPRMKKHASSLPPMAKPNCLLLVRSSLGEDYIFESSCHEERDRIVHLWKMATARLVSHAVVGNGDLMIEEFFNEGFVAGGIYASLISTDDG